MNVLAPELRMADSPHVARFSPWQIIVGTLTAVYASRNLDKLLGLGGTHIFDCISFLRHAYSRTPSLPSGGRALSQPQNPWLISYVPFP